MPELVVFPHDPIRDYALLDCGGGEKLEQVGPYILRRPDPQAMWRPRAPERWERADLAFVRTSDRGGHWAPGPGGRSVPESWELGHGAARFVIRPTPFKHIGLFPEQSSNWAWTAAQVARLGSPLGEPPSVLNLFAYTGAATILATQAGARVTHVDASRPALRWAKENAARSGLDERAVRWIEDDALAFARRERRRGRRYQGLLLDPPPYGRGPKGEKWQFEEQIVELVDACRELLDDGPAFVVVSCYAVGTSPLAFRYMLEELGPGQVVAGELALPEQSSDRLLPAGLCGRWSRSD